VPYYDDEDAVRLPYGARGYEHAADAYRAFVRAYERRKLAMQAAHRGKIKEFSKRSRHRLLTLVARLDAHISGVLVTLTYKSNMQDYELSKQHLDLVLRYLKYHYPQASALWRLEQQQRGAIHYHVMLLTREHIWVDVNSLRAHWRHVIGEDASVNVKWVDNRKRAMMYVSKYVAKVSSQTNDMADSRASAEGNLDSMPYSEKTSLTGAAAKTACEFTSMPASEAPASSSFVGRFWGVFNRCKLPLADEHVFEFGEKFAFEYVELARAVGSWSKSRRRLALCKGNRRQAAFYSWLYNHVKRARVRLGFTIFADAQQWLRWCRTSLGVCA
jgi:hypothetical protein